MEIFATHFSLKKMRVKNYEKIIGNFVDIPIAVSEEDFKINIHSDYGLFIVKGRIFRKKNKSHKQKTGSSSF